jgi:hypothetical protein
MAKVNPIETRKTAINIGAVPAGVRTRRLANARQMRYRFGLLALCDR